MKRIAIFAILGIALVWFLRRAFRDQNQNDLTTHLKEQNDLRDLGAIANTGNLTAQAGTPLSLIGQTPGAGLWIDQFLGSLNPFATLKGVDFNPAQPAPDPGYEFAPATTGANLKPVAPGIIYN